MTETSSNVIAVNAIETVVAKLKRARDILIIPHHAGLRQFLDSLPAREVDAVILLDSQDWMAAGEIRELWTAIDRAGTDNVHVIFRTAGEGSPIESKQLATLRRTWRRDDERSAVGFALDRSGVYGGFRCYGRRWPARS